MQEEETEKKYIKKGKPDCVSLWKRGDSSYYHMEDWGLQCAAKPKDVVAGFRFLYSDY